MAWYSESDFDSSVVKGDWTSEGAADVAFGDWITIKSSDTIQNWIYNSRIYLSTSRTKFNQVIYKFSIYNMCPFASGDVTYNFLIDSDEYSVKVQFQQGSGSYPYIYRTTFYYIGDKRDISSGTSISYSYSIRGYHESAGLPDPINVSFAAPADVISIWVNVNYNTTETKADWRPAFIYVNENFEDEAATTDSWVEPTSVQWYVNSQWYEL